MSKSSWSNNINRKRSSNTFENELSESKEKKSAIEVNKVFLINEL